MSAETEETPWTARPFVGHYVRRVVALSAWCLLVWVLLTWTATTEVLVVGLGVAVVVALTLAPLGEVVAPWSLFVPRRFAAIVVLAADSAVRVVRANLTLARIIWSPRSRPSTGMVIVPTELRGDGALAGLGVITSLVVDNQIVDVDRSRHELLYHCIGVPAAESRYESINGPVERRLRALGDKDD